MKRFVPAVLAFFLLSTTGCLKRQLALPVQDHYVQLQTISDNYSSGKYEENPEHLQEDLEAMAEQARLLVDIVRGEEPDAIRSVGRNDESEKELNAGTGGTDTQ